MASFAQNRQRSVSLGFLLPAIGVAMLAGAVPVLSGNPLSPLFVVGLVFAAAIALFLLQRPLLALCVAIVLMLLPLGLRVEVVYDFASNLTLLIALAAFMLDVSYKRRRVHWNAVCVLIVAYMAWACVTMLWAPELIASRQKLVAYMIGLILVFLMSNQIRSLRAMDAIMRAIAAIGWLLVIGGIQAMWSVAQAPARGS